MRKFQAGNKLFENTDKYESLCARDIVISNIIAGYLQNEEASVRSSMLMELEQ